MVFFLDLAQKAHFLGHALPNFGWPEGEEWLPIEVRTAEGWFPIGSSTFGAYVLVGPD
jgi:hypothetical protein